MTREERREDERKNELLVDVGDFTGAERLGKDPQPR
jgi:hypothetical protein